MIAVAGSFAWGAKHDPSRNREMGRAQDLGGRQSIKNATTNQKTVSLVVELFKRCNKGNDSKGGGRATATRAMAMATTMATTWAMAMAMRLEGDKEGTDKGGKGNDDGNEGDRQQRGGGRQGNGDGDKDGGQVDCNMSDIYHCCFNTLVDFRGQSPLFIYTCSHMHGISN